MRITITRTGGSARIRKILYESDKFESAHMESLVKTAMEEKEISSHSYDWFTFSVSVDGKTVKFQAKSWDGVDLPKAVRDLVAYLGRNGIQFV